MEPAKTQSRRGRRRFVWLLGAGLLVVVLGVVAARGTRDALAARSHLVAAKSELSDTAGLKSSLGTVEGRASAIRRIDSAVGEVTLAGNIVHRSFALGAARFVPYVSIQRSGLVRIIADAHTAAVATRNLLTNVDGLAARGRVTAATVPLGALAAFEADIRVTGTTLAGLRRSDRYLIGPLGRARRDFNVLATSNGGRLLGDADALKVAQSIMGASGPRHYFVALQNNAEMRDQGGVLSYAAVSFDHGRVQVDQHGSLSASLQTASVPSADPLAIRRPADIEIPPGTATVFGPTLPTLFWINVDATADFEFSGRAMQAMYRLGTGRTVDGVFALDVPALSALLSVVGPVTVPGIAQPLTADNAGSVLLHDLYDAFPPGEEQTGRRELLSEVATAVIERLAAGTFDPVPLAQHLATAAEGGHIRAWSADTGEERLLEQDGLGGGPAVKSPDRTFHVAVENRNSTKMDYYVHTATQQQIDITPDGSAVVTTTISVQNTAPVGTPSSYATGPDGNGMTQAAEYWGWVLLWGPAGAMQPGAVNESGLNLSQVVLERIYAGQTKQVSFETVIPHAIRDGRLRLRFVPQPRLVAPTLGVTVKAGTWTIDGKPTWSGAWDKTLNLDWRIHR